MKADSLIIIAAAGLGLFAIYKMVKPAAAAASGTAPVKGTGAAVSTIRNTALPGEPGWGWTYYTDGTAIGPDGKYYFQGTEVYNPAGVMGAL